MRACLCASKSLSLSLSVCVGVYLSMGRSAGVDRFIDKPMLVRDYVIKKGFLYDYREINEDCITAYYFDGMLRFVIVPFFLVIPL